ncbi:MAG: hypothetical protein KJO02_01155, partial [Erythrobacter sp.]|nr:hypothetical protein [Erythrobacter sp.]
LVQAPNPDEGNNGFTIDGRPIYDALDINNAGCNATLVGTGGTPPVYDNLTGDCFGTRLDDFIQLTNGPSYESHIASMLLSKRFDGGLITDGGSVNLRFGYAWTDSENNRDVASSTATSSFDRTAAFDRQNPAVSTSNFETRHNITAAISFREEFFGDYATQLGLYFRARSGRPYSLVFDGGSVFNDSASGSDNALLYVPSGINDPNLSPFSDAIAVQELIDYVAASGCEYTPGASIERNTCRNPWSYDLDMRISQELPFFGKLTGLVDDRLEIFADFDNVLNMIDAEANRVIFNFDIPTSFADYDDEGRYIIDNFNPDDDQSISISGSAWKIQVGARYEF